MQLKCKKCGHSWNYKGQKIYYTSCPDCRNNVKILANEQEKKEILETLGMKPEDLNKIPNQKTQKAINQKINKILEKR